MATRSRIRTRFDAGRLREVVSAPGIDQRSWVFLARVDDDPDAIRWETDYGWIADVTITGSQLDGEGPIPCRVSFSYAGDGVARSEPIQRGVQVVVVMPEGDANGTPVIVGILSTPDLPPPSSVNEESVDEAFAEATHFLRTTHNVDEEIGQTWRVKAEASTRLLAPTVYLAEDNAAQAFVRGNDQLSALGTLLDALDDFATALATPPGAPPNAAVTVAVASAAALALATSIASVRASLQGALSSRILGE